uniref:Uncharacterized protein n=1 Tax=Rhodopseudomonas palustris (strain BisA53) TaxID=316055 RepID=Q07PH8_RHOP5
MRSQTLRKLLLGNYPLDVSCLALDAISQPSVCLDGHALNNRIDVRLLDFRSALRTLNLMMNVVVLGESVGHSCLVEHEIKFRLFERPDLPSRGRLQVCRLEVGLIIRLKCPKRVSASI